jgi:hypothetical protein
MALLELRNILKLPQLNEKETEKSFKVLSKVKKSLFTFHARNLSKIYIRNSSWKKMKVKLISCLSWNLESLKLN